MFKRAVCFSMILCIALVSVPTLMFAKSYASDVVIDEVILEPKDPIVATVIAIGPGLLAHGWGQFYSENYRMGLTLLGLELASIVVMGYGAIQNTSPGMFVGGGGDVADQRKMGGNKFAVGVLLFAATWFADIVLAGRSAEAYNTEHNLEFKVQEESLLNGNSDNTFAAVYNYRF